MPGESPLYPGDQEHLRLLNALRESELLRELSELLASSLDIGHILQVLVRRTTEACDVERCAVWLLDEHHSQFMPSAYHIALQNFNKKVFNTTDRIWRRSTLPIDDPVIIQLIEEHGTLFIEDLHYASSATMQHFAEKFYVTSILLIALKRENKLVGMMSLDTLGKNRAFTPEQQQLARAIGQQAAVAIHNARLYQQAQIERLRAERLIGRAQSIYQVAMAVNSDQDLPTILEDAAGYMVQCLDAQGAAVALLSSDTLSIVAQAGNITPDHVDAAPVPELTDLPHCHQAASTGTSVFAKREHLSGYEENWYQTLGFEHLLIVPLILGTLNRSGRMANMQSSPESTRCVGFVFVNYPLSTLQLTPGQYAFARDIAIQCALAIEKTSILDEANRALELATEQANTLNAVFNAMSEGITVLDMDGEVIVSNKTASNFLGVPLQTRQPLRTFLAHYPTYTLNGKPIPPEDFPLSRALRGDYIRAERFMTRRTDHSERIIEVNVAPLLNSDGRKIGLVSAFRDVTEPVRVERRIRQALETMLHAAEVVSGITDIRLILKRMLTMTMEALSCERGMVQLYQPEQLIFLPLLSIGFDPEAEQCWFEEQKRWLSPPEGHFAGFRDQLLEGHATLVSAEQCPEQPNDFGQTMILAAPISHNGRLLGALLLDRSHLLNGQQTSGTPSALAQSSFNVWDIAVAEGIARFAGLAVEQTRWQQEAEIARINEAAMRKSNELKDDFLAITAHEFRTPLTIILAHDQMITRILRRSSLIEQTLREKINESTSLIEVQAHQLTNIVNTFLDVAKLNRGQIDLVMDEVDLEEIVKQSITDHRATSPLHKLSTHIASGALPYLVKGDRARLLQIFANLLQNAIKYSPLGGPITLSMTQQTHESDRRVIEVCIADKGIGIPLEAQPHLFERFYRASNIEHSKARGIGLGLYVVAEFVRLHGGKIRINSTGVVGEGSRFIFTIPVLERDSSHND